MNFQRKCRKFNIVNGQLMYKEKRLVIDVKRASIHDIHDSLGRDLKAKAMVVHRGVSKNR